ncbi:MAG: VCBS repeat-containing protein [Pseudomonadota bacterium]
MKRLSAVLYLVLASSAAADVIETAQYTDPTTRYAHGVLGDAVEWGGLRLDLTDGTTRQFQLPIHSVFEDTEPRLVDLENDGAPEVIVVESHNRQGAQLAIYGTEGKITATPYIGTSYRWLAPLGATDLDGDGFTEIAYIDRPHLIKTLRVWRYQNENLSLVSSLAGLTNHRIGEPDIAGGIRDCGSGPEIVVATASWSTLVAVKLDGETLSAAEIGTHEGRGSFDTALACQ